MKKRYEPPYMVDISNTIAGRGYLLHRAVEIYKEEQRHRMLMICHKHPTAKNFIKLLCMNVCDIFRK